MKEEEDASPPSSAGRRLLLLLLDRPRRLPPDGVVGMLLCGLPVWVGRWGGWTDVRVEWE